MNKSKIGYMNLGKKLKELRLKKGVLQRHVGNLIDVDGAFISKVENCEKPINRNHLKKLSKYFQISEKELQILWLADKVQSIIENERYAKSVVEEISERFG